MKIAFVALFFILFLSFQSHAQNKRMLDSLNLVYQNAKHDTTKVLALIDIAFEYGNNKPNNSIVIAEKALQMSEKMSFDKGIGMAWNSIGLGNMYKGNYQQALKYTQKAFNIFERIQEYKYIAQGSHNIRSYLLQPWKLSSGIRILPQKPKNQRRN